MNDGSSLHSHRRYNPLLDEWVLVSAGRTRRPWQGQVDEPPEAGRPAYDPACYLCPGNERAGGAVNPDYDTTFVFTNDFAALQPEAPAGPIGDGLLLAEGEQGTCRVLIFSPRHDLTLACMDPADVRRVVDMWADQTAELGLRYRWVQIFENQGEMMGASNPHPHGQLWAGSALPNQPAREDAAQRRYREETGGVLLVDYVRAEKAAVERVVVETERWVVVVPFWAVWPYETLVLPKERVARLPDLDGHQRDDLAVALKDLLARYDNLFDRPFPYSMGWHGAPGGDGDGGHWQLHAHYYPPLLRSATVRKFMVGYEMLAEPQRDILAEGAAARLRDLSGRHSRA